MPPRIRKWRKNGDCWRRKPRRSWALVSLKNSMGGDRVVLPKRGDIYYVNFDPTIGVEIKKPRPALIIQNDIGNTHSPATIVAAITSTARDIFPHEVLLKAGEGGLPRDSIVLLNQVRTST